MQWKIKVENVFFFFFVLKHLLRKRQVSTVRKDEVVDCKIVCVVSCHICMCTLDGSKHTWLSLPAFH